MSQKSGTAKSSSEWVVRDIRRATRRQYSAYTATEHRDTKQIFPAQLERLNCCRNHWPSERRLPLFYSAGDHSAATSVVSWVHAHATSRSANREIKRRRIDRGFRPAEMAVPKFGKHE